ncbi:MAG TPA: M1 family metallopeptidase, partial [Saprospiraceae bacterium]|nr:M1 family metallopeptidase [Saprospiraceae bacterium]
IISIRDGRKSLEYKVQGTILEVLLNTPLYPGDSIICDLTFEAQVPKQIRRNGRNNKEGIDYSMAQWYPKLCNYDEQGWHTPSYIGREFYGPWGDFTVHISIDSDYCLGATGVLLNADEVGFGYSEPEAPAMKKRNEKGKRTWRFTARNVHDFVWAADPDYKHLTYKRSNGLVLHFLYQETESNKAAWNQLPVIMDSAFSIIESRYGPYPYPVYSFIQGGDGGMEYPMATLITGNRPLISLVGVSLHELLHSWYQMMLATNESLYAWMDEGFTSYTEEEVMNDLKRIKLLPGEALEDPHIEMIQSYAEFTKTGLEEPLSTHADHFSTNKAYGVAAYLKGAVCLSQLKYLIGKTAFDKGMLDYYWKWRFRHPNPNDFFRIMEHASGMELDWFKEYFVYTTKTVDYGIDSIYSKGGNTICRLKRHGLFPMPLELKISNAAGKVKYIHIPLNLTLGVKNFGPSRDFEIQPVWSWVNPTYELILDNEWSDGLEVRLNPDQQLMDVNPQNDFKYWNGLP